MIADVEHPDRFVYLPGFIGPDRNAELVRFLEQVPVLAPAQHDPARQFAFTSPIADGTVVQGRREAAAGWPVWDGTAPIRGAAMPAPLQDLAAEAGRSLLGLADEHLGEAAALTFTSVYADRYPPSGTFVPHSDRACYGPTVAGVSLGRGTCRMVFRRDGEVLLDAMLEPGSLYAFSGLLREAPTTHEIIEVDDLRFGVTYRSPAPGLGAGAIA